MVLRIRLHQFGGQRTLAFYTTCVVPMLLPWMGEYLISYTVLVMCLSVVYIKKEPKRSRISSSFVIKEKLKNAFNGLFVDNLYLLNKMARNEINTMMSPV